MLDVVGLELEVVIAGGDGVFIDKVAVFVIEHRHVEGAGVKVAAQAGLIAFAFFRFQIRVRLYRIARLQVVKAAIQRFGGRGTEALGVLAVPGVVVVERVSDAQFWRQAVPDLVCIAYGAFLVAVDGVEEFLGDMRRQLGVVVAQAGHEGPVIPADLVLGEQAVGVDGRVREVAGFDQVIFRAVGAHGGATIAYCQAGARATARTGDFLVLDSGTVGQQVIGVSNMEGFVCLGVQYPGFFFVGGVARTHHMTAVGEVVFQGVLVGFGDLVVQAPLEVVSHGGIQRHAVFQAETLAADGVLAVTRQVHAQRLAVVERSADRAFFIDVEAVLVLLISEAKTVVIVVVPAQLGQYVGGFGIFRVGRGTGQPGAAVVTVGFGFVTVALAQVQQAVEVARAAGDGAGFQPTAIGRAVAGLEAGANILARLDDVIGVEGEVADGTANGVAAIKYRRRATEDFDALDDFRVDVVALGLGVRAVEERVGDLDAVHLGQDPVAVDAADVVVADAATLAGAAYRDTRLIAHQVLDGIDVIAVHILAVMDGNCAGHRVHVLLLASGADGDLLQGQGAGGAAALFQHDIVAGQLAVAQVGADQQALQGFFRGE